jgi:predicted alpha/beta-fold hydrolase
MEPATLLRDRLARAKRFVLAHLVRPFLLKLMALVIRFFPMRVTGLDAQELSAGAVAGTTLRPRDSDAAPGGSGSSEESPLVSSAHLYASNSAEIVEGAVPISVYLPHRPQRVLRVIHDLLTGVNDGKNGASDSHRDSTLVSDAFPGRFEPLGSYLKPEAVLRTGSYVEKRSMIPSVLPGAGAAAAGSGSLPRPNRSDPHVQTMYASGGRPIVFHHVIADVRFRRERIRSSLDGALIVLDWFVGDGDEDGTETGSETETASAVSDAEVSEQGDLHSTEEASEEPRGRPVVLIIPGVASSTDSFYVKRLCQILYDLGGVQPCVYHPRGCSDEMDSSESKMFTLGDTHDLYDALSHLCEPIVSQSTSDGTAVKTACCVCGSPANEKQHQRFRHRVLVAAFSLGTNPILSMLGAHRPGAISTERRSTTMIHEHGESLVAAVIAVSSGFDGRAGVAHLENDALPIYNRGLASKLKGIVAKRHRGVLGPVVARTMAANRTGNGDGDVDGDGDDGEELDQAAVDAHLARFEREVQGIRQFDEQFTLPMRGAELGIDGADTDTLYDALSCYHALRHISVPVMTLNAADDPLIPVSVLERCLDELQQNEYGAVLTVTTPTGGHLGWCEEQDGADGTTHWHERVVAHWCRASVFATDESCAVPAESSSIGECDDEAHTRPYCVDCCPDHLDLSNAPLLRIPSLKARFSAAATEHKST